MTKKITIKNITAEAVATQCDKWYRTIGITFDRTERLVDHEYRNIPNIYSFRIDAWKYAAYVKVMKEKNK